MENTRILVFIPVCISVSYIANKSYAHTTYVICFRRVIISFVVETARGGLRVLPPSIVARFVARDPVSFEC